MSSIDKSSLLSNPKLVHVGAVYAIMTLTGDAGGMDGIAVVAVLVHVHVVVAYLKGR